MKVLGMFWQGMVGWEDGRRGIWSLDFWTRSRGVCKDWIGLDWIAWHGISLAGWLRSRLAPTG